MMSLAETHAQLAEIVKRQEAELASLESQHSVLIAAAIALDEVAVCSGLEPFRLHLQPFADEQFTIDVDSVLSSLGDDINKKAASLRDVILSVGKNIVLVESMVWSSTTAVFSLPLVCDWWCDPTLRLGAFVWLHECMRRFAVTLCARADCRRSLRTLKALLENSAEEASMPFSPQLSVLAAHIGAALQ